MRQRQIGPRWACRLPSMGGMMSFGAWPGSQAGDYGQSGRWPGARSKRSGRRGWRWSARRARGKRRQRGHWRELRQPMQ
ncbi:hypothetical protein BCR44DRAFT_1426060 [Catenaria anguillulae PL171]|uniref:Uncharacterized protein n=1 Tax=Catenaria anguillulae PL171 TaxID=765915 RepID=A0A1Y2HZF3_9FUNG|nr:hypothetical protein BCR44DRAFT_1426060 [Catenaria anguillulae PL171]